MAFVGLFLALLGLGLWVRNCGIFTPHLDLELYYPTNSRICNLIYDMCQYLATIDIVILVRMVITSGLVCYGLITKRPGFLTPWLLISFIGIVSKALCFGYVSMFFAKHTYLYLSLPGVIWKRPFFGPSFFLMLIICVKNFNLKIRHD